MSELFDQSMTLLRTVAEFGGFLLMCYTAYVVRDVKKATNGLMADRVAAAEQVGHGTAMEEVRIEKRQDEKEDAIRSSSPR